MPLPAVARCHSSPPVWLPAAAAARHRWSSPVRLPAAAAAHHRRSSPLRLLGAAPMPWPSLTSVAPRRVGSYTRARLVWSMACRSFKARHGCAEQEAEALCRGHAVAALDWSLPPIASLLHLLLVSVSALPRITLPATASRRPAGSGRRTTTARAPGRPDGSPHPAGVAGCRRGGCDD